MAIWGKLATRKIMSTKLLFTFFFSLYRTFGESKKVFCVLCQQKQTSDRMLSASQSVSCRVSSQLSAGVPRTPIRQRAELMFRKTGVKTCRGRLMAPLQSWGAVRCHYGSHTEQREHTRRQASVSWATGKLPSTGHSELACCERVCPAPQVPPLPSAGKPHTRGLSDVCLPRKGAYLLL